ncbi:hypothetical protein QTP88_008071 [Uroleucon formosanum]
MPVLIDIHLVELADDLAVVGVATTGSLLEDLIDPELEQVDGQMYGETTTKTITLFVGSCRIVVVGVGILASGMVRYGLDGVLSLENQIRTYGSFRNRGNRRQILQAQAEVNEETEIQVLAYVQINPRSSIRHVANEVGINPRKVHSILKKFKIRPYKPDLVHHLRAGDSERRLLFIAWVLVKIEDNPQFLKYVLWTDESKFTNNGVINKQNNRFWASNNPHWAFETNFQTVWGTNVWCGILEDSIIGPYFYDGTLNGRRYLDFLSNHLPPMLENVPLNIRENLFFQQDGAPAHNAIIVRQYLNDQFGNNWMGTNGSIPWPARSPDLTPLDFFLWGHLKTVVYADPPINLQHFKQKITKACSKLTKEQITAASQDEVNRRLQSCLLNNGENFEQFIR